MNEISILIPTYNSPDSLELLLESIINGQKNKNEIIVLIDGIRDRDKDLMYKYERIIEKHKSDVIFMQNEINQGLCQSTNLLAYNATKEKILILNDDNVAPYHFDEKLNEAYQPNSILTPNQIEPSPSIFPQFHIKDLGRTIKDFNIADFWNYEILINKDKIDNTGSTLPIFMGKKTFISLGGWDVMYPGTGMVADWDFFVKANYAGFNLIRTYNTHFYHFVSLTSRTPEEDKKRQQDEQAGHEYAKYKWGNYIKHNPENNLKTI